jgi:flagellar assembly protein FliH
VKEKLPSEEQEKNLSSQFKSSSTFVGLDDAEEKNKDETRLFELNEFLSTTSKLNRGFSFDSETARNFDVDNVKRAKQGVKELMADAITKAKSIAIEIKENAQQEGHKTGYDEGFKAAYEKGENSAKEEFIPLLQTINSLTRELSEFRTMMYPKVEKEMVEIITGLTKKILQHEIDTKEDSVKQMILLAINSVVDKEKMVIRIHPSDKKHAEAFSPELKNLFSEIKNITFEEHSGIEKGGCIIETNFGTIDAQVDQLENQVDKILKLTPAVPVVSPSSEILSEERSDNKIKSHGESTDSDLPASETETKADGESIDSDLPASETETKADGESIDSDLPASETETKADGESTDSDLPASETETKADGESTDSKSPTLDKPSKDTPEKEG